MHNVRPRSLSEGAIRVPPELQAQNLPPIVGEPEDPRVPEEAGEFDIPAFNERQQDRLHRLERIRQIQERIKRKLAHNDQLFQLLRANCDESPTINNTVRRSAAVAHQQLTCSPFNRRILMGGALNGTLAIIVLGLGGNLRSPLQALITALFFACVGAFLVAKFSKNQ